MLILMNPSASPTHLDPEAALAAMVDSVAVESGRALAPRHHRRVRRAADVVAAEDAPAPARADVGAHTKGRTRGLPSGSGSAHALARRWWLMDSQLGYKSYRASPHATIPKPLMLYIWHWSKCGFEPPITLIAKSLHSVM